MVEFSDYLPNIELSSALGMMGVLVAMVFVGGIFAAIAVFVVNSLRYNKKIIIFENIRGQGPRMTGKDKATLVKVGKGGEEVLYLKKRKVYRGSSGHKMDKNTYWFAIGDDSYWYNITLGDLDTELRKINVKPTSVNMRYQYVALQKAIGDRYDKVGFWQKYGGLVAYTGLIAVTGIMLFLIFDQFIEFGNTVSAAVEASQKVTEEAAKVIGALDNLKSGGSGIVNA